MIVLIITSIVVGVQQREGRPSVRIHRVDLSNIKSYRRASIHLNGGATAVRGQNGAGKSTLLEAIGFALFDYQPYKQSQLVREGERVGQITVAFQSALDDRIYETVRRCGGASEWFVYDPELSVRVAEQTTDVKDFLRRHLRIENDLSLDALFRDALGVPQGTFTADFLLTPGPRKQKFDILLQVDEYRKAYEKLNETAKYYTGQLAAQDHRIEDLERETGQLDAWRLALNERRAREHGLIDEIANLQRETIEVEGKREALRQQEAQVTRLGAAAQAAQAEHARAEERLGDATARRAEARTAANALAETHGDHAAYLAAEAQRAEAEVRDRQRKALNTKREARKLAQAKAQSKEDQAALQLTKAQQAAEHIIDLQAAIAEQSKLEAVRNDATKDAQSLHNAEAGQADTQKKIAAVEREIAIIQRKIEETAAKGPLANLLGERRARLEALQAAEGARAQREKRLAAIATERRAATEARDKARDLAARAGDNIAKILKYAELAAQVPLIEQERVGVEQDTHAVEAELAHHTLSRQQSGGGNCPFLGEPCLNIRQRGVNSLVSYFDQQIADCETRLTPLRVRLADLDGRLQQARKAQDHYSKLESNQERQQAENEACAYQETHLARLADEEADLTRDLAPSDGGQALAEARRLVAASDAADKDLSALPSQQAQLTSAKNQLDGLNADANIHERQIAQYAGAEQREKAAKDALAQLDDPRGRARGLLDEANQRERYAAELAAAKAKRAQCDAELAACDEALRPFATLDADLAALDADLLHSRPGHTRYLQHERVAATLPEREAAHATANEQATQANAAHAEAARRHTEAAANFDAAALQRARQRAEELREQQGRANEDLRHVKQERERLEQAIAQAEALLGELSKVRAERQELDESAKMLKQFRETIKDAGPQVTKALLHQISVTANHIFGDLMGDRAAQLSWEDDYEIMLRHDGRERTFAQLSGGEQMSAALAVRLALLRKLSRLDIAFFDEPTQNMDDERRGNLAEQIRRVRGFDQLIVISHDDTFEQGLDNVIHLDKRNGETVLVDEDALVAIG